MNKDFLRDSAPFVKLFLKKGSDYFTLFNLLCELVGIESTIKLIRFFGGQQIRIPRPNQVINDLRNELVGFLHFVKGLEAKEIAVLTGLPYTTVKQSIINLTSQKSQKGGKGRGITVFPTLLAYLRAPELFKKGLGVYIDFSLLLLVKPDAFDDDLVGRIKELIEKEDNDEDLLVSIDE